MEIVINIPDLDWSKVKNGSIATANLLNAVKNGTPLPKGHGRLIDEKEISLSGIHFKTEIDHARMIGRLNTAPTIIPADKEASDASSN